MSRLRPLVLALALALAGCGGGGSDLPVPPKDAVQAQVENGYTPASAASPAEVNAVTNDNYRLDLITDQGVRLSIASPCYRPQS